MNSPTLPRHIKLAYLMSQYPGVSHTFFLNEIQELRRQGVTISTASINNFGNQRAQTPIEAGESASTYYPKYLPVSRIILITLKILFLRPAVFFRGLGAALKPEMGYPSRLFYALFYFMEGLLLGEWMEREELKHLHVHFGGAVATVGRITSIAFRIPYSITIHGAEEFYDEQLFHLRIKVRDASFVLCISHFCRSQLMRRMKGDQWKKLNVSRLGIDTALFHRRMHQNSGTPIQIVCTGRLIVGKGQRVLIEACARLIDKGGLFHLTIIGDGPDRAGLVELAQRLGIAEHVHFTGATTAEQTRAYLAQADIFSLPSFAEGIPVALMEAMACQVPCVSTYVAGIPELITDGIEGLLVPPSSIDDLTEAISRLSLDADLRQRMGVAARERIDREYCLSSNVEILADIFQNRLLEEAFSAAPKKETVHPA